MSTNSIYAAVLRASAGKCGRMQSNLCHLDIGAGRGELIRLLREAYRCESDACDYHVERFELKDVPVVAVDLNRQPLPYADERFDLVTCSEVVEHLENYRSALRGAYRVLKPGGAIVVTTPNVLNAYSRVRYLVCGFANLFGPLPTRNDKLYSTGGHITPIPYFYLAHALADAGFVDICLEIDKIQRTSVFWLLLFFPLIILGWKRFKVVERKKYRTLTADNEQHVRQHSSHRVLLGRTIVVSATRPAEGGQSGALR